MANKALFLDRDGVINVDKDYVYQADDFVFIDGIFDLCQFFAQQGYQLFIITNQSGIARGFYTEADFKKLMLWVRGEFEKQDVQIEKSYFCPHHPTIGIEKYKMSCDCRKPEAGMIFQAEKEFNLDLANSILIGDKNRDIDAGIKAGLKQCYLIESENKGDFVSIKQMYQQMAKQ